MIGGSKGSKLAMLIVGAAFLMLAAAAGGSAKQASASGPPDTYVASWDALAMQALTAAAASPTDGFVIFANIDIAVYDSVVSIEGRYEPFAVDVDVPDASPEAAVAAAAHRVLVHYLPSQAATILDPAYSASLATIPDGALKTNGVAVGESVAQLLIAKRSTDGFRATVPYTPPSPPIPGKWLPTAPTPPVGTDLPGMTPFALDSADQFRPNGPPDLSSRMWAREYNEIMEIGSSTSSTRTAEQTLAARFWGESPLIQGEGALRKFVLDRQLDILDAARFMAMTSVARADAAIACFDAKYHYAFWRPITAIRAGDTDGNAATVGDTSWSHLLPATPNHPEYPSAHSCITPAEGLAMAEFLGTDEIDLTIPSVTGLGDRHYATVADLEYEVSNARIWGGIHFRSAVEDGVKIAHNVTRQVLAHNFRKTHD
jgi:hypothetical protein